MLPGFYFGRPGDPVLAAGLPDLLLTWHVDPASALHRRLHADTDGALQRWVKRPTETVSRELRPQDWESVRARCSAALLLGVPDPRAAFLAWFDARLDEWEADGVSAAIRGVFTTEPPTPDDAPDPPDDTPDDPDPTATSG